MKSIASLCLALVAAAGASAAQAQDARCPRLKSELAALQTNAASQNRVTQYQNAIDRQNAEYERTFDYVRSIGCDIDPQAAPECRALDTNLQRMRRNLETLEAQYRRLSDDAGQGREDERQRLQAMIEDLACDGAAPRQAARRSPDLFESLFGPDEAEPAPAVAPPLQEGDLPDYNSLTPDDRFLGRTLRTICVRKCDGFYFPISFATSSSRFADDAEACAKQCPTAEVELYAYDTYSQQPEDAISTTSGVALKDMPNAFRFRTSFDAACTCKTPGQDVAQSQAPPAEALKRLDEASLDAAAAPKKPAAKVAPVVPVPMSAAPKPTVPEKTIETVTSTGERKRVRVIGPQLLPQP